MCFFGPYTITYFPLTIGALHTPRSGGGSLSLEDCVVREILLHCFVFQSSVIAFLVIICFVPMKSLHFMVLVFFFVFFCVNFCETGQVIFLGGECVCVHL